MLLWINQLALESMLGSAPVPFCESLYSAEILQAEIYSRLVSSLWIRGENLSSLQFGKTSLSKGTVRAPARMRGGPQKPRVLTANGSSANSAAVPCTRQSRKSTFHPRFAFPHNLGRGVRRIKKSPARYRAGIVPYANTLPHHRTLP